MRKAAASAAFSFICLLVKYNKQSNTQLHVWEKKDMVCLVRLGGISTDLGA
jgi:hypothetical protein